MFEVLGPDDYDKNEKYRDVMLPMIDQGRSTITAVWMSLPAKNRTVEEVERQVRRLVDRACRDLREDATAFGLPNS